MAKQFLAAALRSGSGGRERRNPAIGRIGNNSGPEGLHDAGAKLPEGYVVSANALGGGGRRRLRVFGSHHAFPLGCFLACEEPLIFEAGWTFQGGGGSGVPDACEI